ncbi:type I secretion C-terminal target domain-containing protein [Sphingobium sp. AS12]|uniref:M10 family metallopeptidase C-terminal domain-containing protein n=1 Tax=Sphingobium sp. AS12 TaxID=2849495 RepID=UPI001C31701C|nr:type I secretion C-terminal target domain-containing protein [Sphingobium sp. AS12]MBV2147706.1 type I secretion C-terminal target domain-containing protein [Sphingobium sp. AS12]
MEFSDFANFLLSYNFIGGSGSSAVPGVSVTLVGTGLDYKLITVGFANTVSSLPAYYSSTNEYYYYVDDYNSTLQSNYENIVLNGYVSSDSDTLFDDVAKINFGPATGGDLPLILIGQLEANYPIPTSSGSAIPDPDLNAFVIQYNPSLFPSNASLKHGDIFFYGEKDFWESGYGMQSQGYKVILEETLHALGVDSKLPSIEGTYLDNQKYTVAAYAVDSAPGMFDPITGDRFAPHVLQIMDIAALQAIYGANFDKRSGDTTYTLATMNPNFVTDPDKAFLYTIWDGGGNDTLNAGASQVSAEIDLRQGRFSSIGNTATGLSEIAKDEDASSSDPDPGNVAIAFNAIIENATGSNQDDTLIGNAWNNVLRGGAGNDYIYGDGEVYDSNVGYGAVSGEHHSGNGAHIAAADGSGADTLYGGGGDDHIWGGDGNDTLWGESGSNVLTGGTGDDHYRVDFAQALGSDRLQEVAVGGGIDTLRIINADGLSVGDLGFSYEATNLVLTLGGYSVYLPYIEESKYYGTTRTSFVENIEINGTTYDLNALLPTYSVQLKTPGGFNTHTGTSGNDTITGSSGNDVISSYNGDDTLDGGAGDDQMYGSYGDDIYYASSGHDFVVDAASDTTSGGAPLLAGFDKIIFNYTMDEVEIRGTYGGLDLLFIMPDGSTLVIDGQYSISGSTLKTVIEQAVFTDGTLDLTTVPEGISIYSRISAGSGAAVGFYTNGTTEIAAYNDRIFGSATNPNVLNGGAGDDIIYSFGAGDTLNGGTGNDFLHSGGGNDTLTDGAGDDHVYGESGNDVFRNNGGGIDLLDGGSGNDTYYLQLSGIGTIRDSSGSDLLNMSYYGSYADLGSLSLIHAANSNDAILTVDYTNLTYVEGFYSNAIETYRMWDAATSTYVDRTKDWILSNVSFIGSAGTNAADTVTLTAADTYYGLGGSDVLIGSAFSDFVYGGTGTDTINGGAGNDILFGDNGVIDDRAEADLLYGGAGNDTLFGEGGNDTLYGEADNDSLRGGYGDDTLYGGDGNDNLEGEEGSNILYGGAGSDTANYDLMVEAGVEASLILGTAKNVYFYGLQLHSEQLFEIENLSGTGHADSLEGDANANILIGRGGNDYLQGWDGADTLLGGEGNDFLIGGLGSDTLTDSSTSSNDRYFFAAGGGIDLVTDNGGANVYQFTWNGTDAITQSQSGSTFSTTVGSGGSAYGAIITGNMTGSAIYFGAAFAGGAAYGSFAGADVSAPTDFLRSYQFGASSVTFTSKTGTSANETINGNDTLFGLTAHDVLYGYGGNDTISGLDGNDTLYGGDGDDVVSGEADNDTLWGGAGADYLWGNTGNDILYGEAGADALRGMEGDDTLYGGDDADNLRGDDVDYLSSFAGAGNDTIYGGGGNDNIHGGAANDIINGEAGQDTLFGDAGADTFVFDATSNAMDYVSDFSTSAGDVIDITGLIGFDSGLGHAIANFVQLQALSSHTRVQVDRDGTGSTYAWENALQIQNVTGLNLTTLISNGSLIVE